MSKKINKTKYWIGVFCALFTLICSPAFAEDYMSVRFDSYYTSLLGDSEAAIFVSNPAYTNISVVGQDYTSGGLLMGTYDLTDSGIYGDVFAADGVYTCAVMGAPQSYGWLRIYDQSSSLLAEEADDFLGNSLEFASASLENNYSEEAKISWDAIADSRCWIGFWNDGKTFTDGSGYLDLSETVELYTSWNADIDFDGSTYFVDFADAGKNLPGGTYHWGIYTEKTSFSAGLDGGSFAGGTLTVVPEPATSLLMLAGIGMIGFFKKKS
ncbi:MAG: PEP-CTERM sorting domain-containing protein [PVC group bacterium]|nr:PEP-CTERM sorting domain-containing protein [PVC group bacterium]